MPSKRRAKGRKNPSPPSQASKPQQQQQQQQPKTASGVQPPSSSSWLLKLLVVAAAVLCVAIWLRLPSSGGQGRIINNNSNSNSDSGASTQQQALSLPRLHGVATGSAAGVACDVSQFLTEEIRFAPRGFHVLCFDGSAGGDRVTVTGYRDGHNATGPRVFQAKTNKLASLRTAVEMGMSMERGTGLGRHPFEQPWAFFSPHGERLHFVSDVLGTGVVFAFEGGQFIWPGVKVGHRVKLDNVQTVGSVWIETISLKPLVVSVENFLTDDECTKIEEAAKPHMKASVVSLMDKDKGKKDTEWRTSTTHWLHTTANTPFLQDIDKRVSQLTAVPISHQESVQVLRYDVTQKYDAHHDYFDPTMYANNAGTMAQIEEGYKNRMATVFWYLTDVEEGGHTWFPRFNAGPPPANFKSCDSGLLVPPKKGKVIIFYSLLASGELDEYSLHGGCPVKNGQKWSANKWVWNKKR